MDLFACRRLAAELAPRMAGRKFGGLARLDPRRVRIRLGDESWTLLLDESLCAVLPADDARPLRERTTSLDYVDEALTGFEAAALVAEPGCLRIDGASRGEPRALVLVGPPRSFLVVLSAGQPAAGYRRPLARAWDASLPEFDPAATDAPPTLELLERWEREATDAMRETALSRLSRSLTVPLARELRHRAGGDAPGALEAAAHELFAEAGSGGDVFVYPPSIRPLLVSSVRLAHEPRTPAAFRSVSEAAAAADAAHLEPARLAHHRRAASRLHEVRRDRASKALERLAIEAGEFRGREQLERQAHILMAHGTRLGRGLSETSLPDLEDPDRQVRIPLDPLRTGVENATAMIRRAARLARRGEVLERRVREVTEARDREAAEAARIASEATWQELEAQGVLAGERAAPEAAEAREEARRDEPLRLVSEEGWDILVGRNDRQNEFLTHRLARSTDLWFHAEHVPGSHVLLRRGGRKGDPSARTLEEVAGYAAFMSKSRTSSDVPVLVTEKRFVRKARGGPGKVTVERAKMLIVTPRKLGPSGASGR